MAYRDSTVNIFKAYADAAARAELSQKTVPDILAMTNRQAEIVCDAAVHCARFHGCVGVGRNNDRHAAVDRAERNSSRLIRKRIEGRRQSAVDCRESDFAAKTMSLHTTIDARSPHVALHSVNRKRTVDKFYGINAATARNRKLVFDYRGIFVATRVRAAVEIEIFVWILCLDVNAIRIRVNFYVRLVQTFLTIRALDCVNANLVTIPYADAHRAVDVLKAHAPR